MSRIRLLLVISVLLGCSSEAQERYYCRVTDMPLSWAFGPHPVGIAASEVAFTDLGTTDPSIKIINRQAAAITNIAFVIEYLDKAGNVVNTAVAANAAKGYEHEMPTPFPVENPQVWEHPVEPGGTAWVTGMSDGNRTLVCAVGGRITFVLLRVRNGEIERCAASAWQVPPLPRMVPYLNVPCPTVDRVVEIPARLRISVTGDVIGISADDLAHAQLVTWAATQVKNWKFHPAVVGGEAKESDLKVEFVFYPGAEVNTAVLSPSSPGVLLSFFSSNRDPAPRCVEAFAFLSEGDTIP